MHKSFILIFVSGIGGIVVGFLFGKFVFYQPPVLTNVLPVVARQYTGAEKLILRGTLKTIQRPAPDVPYDYELTLDVPFYDPLNASGLTQVQPSFVVVAKDNSTILVNQLKTDVGKHVEIEGYLKWGLAETRYLEAESIDVQ